MKSPNTAHRHMMPRRWIELFVRTISFSFISDCLGIASHATLGFLAPRGNQCGSVFSDS